MGIKRLTCASAVAIALGATALATGAGPAAAQPGRPSCDFGNCQGPGGPGGPGGHGGHGPDRGPGAPGGPDRGPGEPGGPGGPGGPDRGPGGGPGWPGGHDRGPGGPDRGNNWGPPPPNLAWRGIDQGRFDHQPFNYNGQWVSPFFNPDFNNWGFWLFGIWIPL
ncbi:hypothetical protein M1247_08005 [Mycobacterium sp. 21AC1]|uniref:hypothetical protein n=1 Tax=[Mycobacterium] appelbergii TaxID=2939269 RepID=UPI0029390513|nr:hypothetical protein [Mycobacterium sp. 21AC1]MDV3124852.1 hypothetical protein [Mycobacterium sp. 21AC1]